MKHQPALAADYLAGKIDEYVKQQARDTISQNCKADKRARWARIPDGNACDFCKMLGSRGFVYRSAENAGEGNDFHPHCNCQVAVTFKRESFDYYSNGVHVVRAYGGPDAQVTRPGRDGSLEMRAFDIDALFAEYQAMGKAFTATSRYASHAQGWASTVFDKEEGYQGILSFIDGADSLDELRRRCEVVDSEWRFTGLSDRYWSTLSTHVQEMKRELSGTIPGMLHEERLVILSEETNGYSVSPVVNTKRYHDAFESLPIPKPVRESAYREAGRLLQLADGRNAEYLIAIDHKTGRLIADNLGRPAMEGSLLVRTGFTDIEVAKIEANGSKVITIHNHPASTLPSYRDLITIAEDPRIAGGLVLAHDGGVWYVAIDNPEIAEMLQKLYTRTASAYGPRARAKAVEVLLDINSRKDLFVFRKGL